METLHTPTLAEVEQMFAPEEDRSPVATTTPLRDRPIPEFLRPTVEPTFELLVDSDLPIITLIRALATQTLTLRPYKGKLVLTHRPELFA